MIEEDARARKQAIRLPIVGHLPERRSFGHRVRAAGPKRCELISASAIQIPKAFTRASIIEADGPPSEGARSESAEKDTTSSSLNRIHRVTFSPATSRSLKTASSEYRI
jgi:hypothetical protein